MKFEKLKLNDREQSLHDRAIRVSKTYRKCEGILIDIIDEVDRLYLYEKFGERSKFDYCRKQLELTESISYALIGIARKSRVVPELKLAVQEGDLSATTASRLCSQITPQNQKNWIETATSSTKAELEQKLAKANPKRGKRTSKKPVNGETTRLAIDLPNSVLAMHKRVREIECQRKRKAVSEAETMAAAYNSYLDRHDPVRKAERAKENVIHPTSAPSVGRTPRKAHEEHARNRRDRGRCQLELPDGSICNESTWTEGHHIIAVALGGSNDPSNMITLCSKHHSMIHKYEKIPRAKRL